ncbi:MAG: chloramphenicol acetyltransferase [Acidobacteriota bacterium]|nr:chloramphenicol acetyltransferase [Acidobacteriota bacterium]MDH3528815.1 chloramphenicol acetyltransferase [Acidobacteriota bacterium]
MFKPVDLENWNRKSTFEFFREFEDPFFNVTVPLDVTALLELCRSRDISFAAACLYFSQESANRIREFRIRLMDGQLVEFERVEATQTIIQDDETFSFCYLPWRPDLVSFSQSAREAVTEYKKKRTFDVETGRVDLIYYSVLPWLAFTSFKHATRYDPLQTVPRIAFGKYTKSGGRYTIPISVEVHHAMMDGIHVGKYVDLLQRKLEACGETL